MKTYTFTSKNNNSNYFLNTSYTKPNYSKIIDDGILADIIKKNSYMFGTTGNKYYTTAIDTTPIITGTALKGDDDFITAATFLANYKKAKKIKLPYILGKMYTLSDGTPIVFYDDEIQIGFDTYKYSDFTDLSFLNNLTNATKKIIIKIYINSGANININL